MGTLTLQDVADLAKVRRPVVSMWRKRPTVRGVSMPFPDPVETVAGVARFSQRDVVAWLERTGRGNNVEISADAPTFAIPNGAALEDVVTLLCWTVMTGRDLSGTTPQTRAQLAAEFDPDDAVLLREIRMLHPPEAMLEYVDDLVAASFGPSDALERVDRGRLKRAQALRDLTAEASALLRTVASACAGNVNQDEATLRIDDPFIPLEIIADDAVALVTANRLIRRRAVIKGISLRDATPGRGVTLSSVVGASLADALDQADEVVVGLRQGSVAVVLGSAAALSDALAGPLQQRRSQTLRVGNVVAAMRLPRGMWREAHRQSLAMWVCLGGATAHRPWVADLGAVGTLQLDDLAADIVGALSQTEDRAFRYARRSELATILAAGPVAPRGIRAPELRSADSSALLDRVHSATLTTTSPLESVDILVAPAPGRFRLQHRSLAELHSKKHLIIKRGNRINPAFASVSGTIPVLPADGDGHIAFDAFDAGSKYPHAARTDPGDVIFIEKPRPRAWVDATGGAMVASPARIIRLRDTAEFGPNLLATIINETAAAGSEWQTWNVPVLTRDEADRLEAALIEVEEFERQARRRADAARDLKKALIDGVAAGALTLDAEPTTPGVVRAVN